MTLVRYDAHQVRLALRKNTNQYSCILVNGARGRCGSDFNNILRWDINETKKGGPFREITESDYLETASISMLNSKVLPR
ncbi:Alanine dehydrogenase/PNT, C-terminal domain [Schizosaccharomyces osmophilus]|uniref:Alanine dehydrogenase/PNT, C-terminal domain n=1 Tax=Schizosaccharomyces osmophilus TaxID=2545709 RepID=A0AAE9WAX1_9SCHI|nr:Alanine dehydrogenase/PNT, C-terminal domain [Schizosaccharomyces osmophilus]WBW72081.1 Alanine dehydrogenase/PNT, C-terminal domain [Schizosaccharomyces osmophilus]